VRNGKSRKTVQSAVGDLAIDTPRDRAGSFEPELVKKRQVTCANTRGTDVFSPTPTRR
jgi:putative transposase